MIGDKYLFIGELVQDMGTITKVSLQDLKNLIELCESDRTTGKDGVIDNNLKLLVTLK